MDIKLQHLALSPFDPPLSHPISPKPTTPQPNRARHRAQMATDPSMNPSTVTDCLSECLEIAIHQILYCRKVYPQSIFESRSYLGVSTHTSRHPVLNKYISDTVKLAGPALASGTAGALMLLIIDEAKGNSNSNGVLERFVFDFEQELSSSKSRSSSCSTISSGQFEQLRSLENGFRNLIMKLLTLNECSYSSLPHTATFKLCLQAHTNYSNVNIGSESETLQRALQNGEWYQPDTNSCVLTVERGVRMIPLKSVEVVGAGIRMMLNLEREEAVGR